ncbi:DUF7352 domain-containing protein [Galbibacter sp. BG1]
MRIYKYDLSIKEEQTLVLPLGARILRVDDVDGKFFLWAIVNPDEERKEKFHFEFYKTGQDFKSPAEDLSYIGFCKLFIAQELGLYVFINNKKSGACTEQNQ